MTEHTVCALEELAPGTRRLVQIDGREIVVFNIDGELVAYTNWCLHQAGPICEGSLTGTREAEYDPERRETSFSWCRDGEILNCPWHGWEFDVLTGDCKSRADAKLVSHDVRVEDETVVLEL